MSEMKPNDPAGEAFAEFLRSMGHTVIDCTPAPVGDRAVGDETRLSFTPEELGHVCEEAGQDALRAADVPELRSELAAARAEITSWKGDAEALRRLCDGLNVNLDLQEKEIGICEGLIDTLAKALRRLKLNWQWNVHHNPNSCIRTWPMKPMLP